MDPIESVDPTVAELIRRDLARQNSHIHLIASENFASPAVMMASGSIFTNKYAEGYPGRRYYEGCSVVDEVENLAIDRAKELFGSRTINEVDYEQSILEHANAKAEVVRAEVAVENAPRVVRCRSRWTASRASVRHPGSLVWVGTVGNRSVNRNDRSDFDAPRHQRRLIDSADDHV